MEKLKVWFNHWFSTAYHIIELMKRDEKYDLYIIGSNRNRDSVVQLACNEWYTEPSVMGDSDYLQFCLDFCKEHKVDVFVPRRGMKIISENAALFHEIGVKLFLDTNSEITKTFASKLATYRLFEKENAEFVPMYFDVSNINEFRKAYIAITAEHDRACFKFSEDEGAVSFRVIDNVVESEKALYTAPGMKISYDAAEKLLSSYSFHNHLLVMPYLNGVEVSADCLRTKSGNIIVPRFKSNGRIYTIEYDEQLIRYCEQVLDVSGLEMPCNIQFKYHNGKAYLLEINTRMSGGLQLSCLGAEVNIPNIALNKLMGNDKEWTLNRVTRKVSHIESPLIVP